MRNAYIVTYSDELNHDSLQTVRSPMNLDQRQRKAKTTSKNVGSFGKIYSNVYRGGSSSGQTGVVSKKFAPISGIGKGVQKAALESAVKIAEKEMASANLAYASKKAQYESYKETRMKWQKKEDKALQDSNEAYDVYKDKKDIYDSALRDLQKLDDPGKL